MAAKVMRAHGDQALQLSDRMTMRDYFAAEATDGDVAAMRKFGMMAMIQNRDSVEFYDGAHKIAQAWSSMAPPIGAKIAIFEKIWTVQSVAYEFYQSASYERGMRANVYVVRDA